MAFLFTPGRVTITNELELIRRIALNARAPTQHEETNSGVSVAHWEGRTLVVENAGLNPEIGLNEPVRKLPVEIGRNVRIVEHLSLKEADVIGWRTRYGADVQGRPTASYFTRTLIRDAHRHSGDGYAAATRAARAWRTN